MKEQQQQQSASGPFSSEEDESSSTAGVVAKAPSEFTLAIRTGTRKPARSTPRTMTIPIRSAVSSPKQITPFARGISKRNAYKHNMTSTRYRRLVSILAAAHDLGSGENDKSAESCTGGPSEVGSGGTVFFDDNVTVGVSSGFEFTNLEYVCRDDVNGNDDLDCELPDRQDILSHMSIDKEASHFHQGGSDKSLFFLDQFDVPCSFSGGVGYMSGQL